MPGIDDRALSDYQPDDDLKGRSVRGGVVTLTGQGGRFVLQLGSMMVLARLLAPEDFGLLAMVAAVTGVVGVFKDFGLASATVQRKVITHREVSNLFWINAGVSVLLMLIAAAAAPLIAAFYDEPRLVGITLVLATTFLLGGLTAQHLALLRRAMRFTTLAVIEVAALAVSVVAAVLAAWSGAGYWALVLMQVVLALTKMVLSWFVSDWRPAAPTRAVDVRPMVRFGANLSGFAVVNYVGRNADDALIGWQLGADTLGMYSRAYAVLMMPIKQIDGPLTGVAVPGLSRLQDQPAAYRRFYCQSILIISYLALPLISAMAAVPTPIILVFLGDQWMEAGAIFRFLAFAAILQPVLFTAGWIHTSLGRTDRMFRWSLVSVPLFVLSFAAGLPWGATGVALGYAICVNALFFPTMAYAFHGSPVSVADLVGVVWRPLLLSAILYAVASSVAAWLPEDTAAIATIAYSLAAGGAVSAISILLVPGARQQVLSLLALRHELLKGPGASRG